MQEVDVLVAGAGPVGLTLANELLRRGARIRIVDAAPAIREVSKAMIWHVRTQEALDRVGILQRGLAEAVTMREVVMRAYGKRIGAWTFPGIDSPHPYPALIGQNRTEHLLLDRLTEQGGTVEWNTTLSAIDVSDPSHVVATLHGERDETVRAAYVVGCEGSNSVVRKALGLTFEGERYEGEQFIQADCRIAWPLPRGRSYLFLTDDGYLMVIELPGDIVRIFISLPDNIAQHAEALREAGASEDTKAVPTLDEITEHFRRLTGIDAHLTDATWLARFRTSHRYAERFRAGRCFLAGDAGHVHVPIGGQGMNTGIQDAFNLGWKLGGVVAGRYGERLLDTYDEERHPVAEALLRGTDRAYRGVLHPSELQQKAIRMFGPFVMRSGFVQHTFAAVLEEITIAYDRSALNRDLGGSSGPRPGHRAPVDAVVVTATGLRTVRLADVVRDDEWTLLLFAGTRPGVAMPPLPVLTGAAASLVHIVVVTTQTDAAEIAGTTTIIDAEEEAHRAYGAGDPALVLIRPDGIVGLRSRGFDGPAVEAYLRDCAQLREHTAANA